MNRLPLYHASYLKLGQNHTKLVILFLNLYDYQSRKQFFFGYVVNVITNIQNNVDN